MKVLLQLPFILLLIQSTNCLYGQVDSLPYISDKAEIILEDLLQSTGEDADFDFNTVYESLNQFARHPLNLNKASAAQLAELNLLNDVQINDLIRHIQEFGELISLLELQTIPSFNQETIQAILPYVSISSNLDDYQLPISKMLWGGRNEIYIRWERGLEEQRGFTEKVQPESRFLGDPNRLYFRCKYSYENKLSYGITAEKDSGEPFFSGPNQNRGFDFYSAHLFLRNYNKRIKSIAIGDYAISFGQGLILHSGFGYGKSNFVLNIKKTAPTLRPYTSVSEVGFMRGVGITLGLGNHFLLTAFGSITPRDGRVIIQSVQDTISEGFDNQLAGFSSLLNTGLHRNFNEIRSRNSVQLFTTGASLRYQQRNGHIGVQTVYNQFNTLFLRNTSTYNQFYFSGDRLLNTSIDYSIIRRNFNLFGETAISDNGAIATLNSVLIGLDRKINLAILHRDYAFNYVALNANSFGETINVNNEKGLYMGMIMRVAPRWEWSGYFDIYEHPWLRFRADAPSKGHDWRTRLRFYKKRDIEAYFQMRYEIKEQNFPNNDTKIDFLAPLRTFQGRIHVAKQITPTLEVRSRFDWGWTDNGLETERSEGICLLQDIIYRPKTFPVSFSTRFAIFDTDGFSTRFYHYENNLLYTFSIPAYYNKGTRFYINARYRGIRNLMIEARYEQTYWSNQNRFGSGITEIQSNIRSEVSAQVKYQF